MVYHNLSGTTSSDLGIGNGKSTSKVLRATATVLQVLDDAANLVPIEVGSPTTDDSAITRKYFLDHSTSAITGAATTIVTDNLTANRVAISNESGKVSVSSVTNTELGYLSGVSGNIQSQITNIPKYHYLNGLSASTTDVNYDSATASLNIAIIALSAAYASANKWDACVVTFSSSSSNRQKDCVYYYDGAQWNYLYTVGSYTSTPLANGDTAGKVLSSTDITFTNGSGVVNHATDADTLGKVSADTYASTAITNLEINNIMNT